MGQLLAGRVASPTRPRRWPPIDARHVVPLAALAAVLLRLPGLTRPIRADEAGFTLVARAWDPGPGSLYGTYFVDRPPPLIAVFGLSDAIGGPLFIRALGALACGVLVLLAAAAARQVSSERAARWTAVTAAALAGTAAIDAVGVKGELLALPFLIGSCLLTIRALKAEPAGSAVTLAAGAGLLAALALGMKQNLVGGLVFGLVLVVGARATGGIGTSRAVRLLAGAAAGAAAPVLATIAWTVSAGVPLSTLWYDVIGFRSDAAAEIARSESGEVLGRAGLLVVAGLASGLLVVVGVYLAGLRSHWRVDPALTAAVLALLAVDGFALVAGGSFWRDYLFPLVPGALLCVAVLAGRASRGGRWMRRTVGFSAGSAALALIGWTVVNALGLQEYDEVDTGRALAAVAAPGDSLVVFGGRADVQLTSGMASPYEHLWSLPMRTLDPDLDDLEAAVTGANSPTWIVEWVEFDTWDDTAGDRFDTVVRQRYDVHGTGCGGRTVWLAKGTDRPDLTPDCHG